MCGIAGFFSKDHDNITLQRMTLCLQHRGPDADGSYFDSNAQVNIGLGHRRLSIIDLSAAGNQPMYSHCGRYVMVYNGELYNYEDIRREKLPGVAWRSTSDTEVILECFVKYGDTCFQWFNGMFALAIWDKTEQSLTLARDHVGIKPLFYHAGENGVVFGSELKAIRQAEPTIAVNRDVIPAFLHLGYIPHPWSIYRDVRKLAAGSFVKFSWRGNRLEAGVEQSFWKIQDKITGTTLSNESEAKGQLSQLLFDAVKRQLVSDVPIGTFLSGGTDSSLITTIATQVAEKKVKTFSIAFTDGKINEAPFAAAVAKHLDTEHYELPITQKDILDMIPGFLNVYDEPFCDSSAFPTMLVSKLARKYVTVALSGDGGDELFLGYGSYLWAQRLKRPLFKLGAPAIRGLSRMMNSRYKRIGHLFDPYPRGNFKSHLFSQDHYFFTENEIASILVDRKFSLSNLNYSYTGRPLEITEEVSFWDIENYLKDNLLVKVDRASMKYSLETRVPLLDYRVIEFALNLSPNLKLNSGGVMKYLLKQVLYDFVPPVLLDRPKWGFGVPLNHWLKKDLKWLVDKYCARDVVEQVGVVHYSAVKDIIEKYSKGNNDYLYNRVWALTVLHWFLYEQQ